MKFKRNGDKIKLYDHDGDLLFEADIEDDKFFIPLIDSEDREKFEYVDQIEDEDYLIEYDEQNRYYVPLASIGIEIIDDEEDDDRSEEDEDVTESYDPNSIESEIRRAVEEKMPTYVPPRVRKRTTSVQGSKAMLDKYEKLNMRGLQDNLRNSIINNEELLMDRSIAYRDAIKALYDDSKRVRDLAGIVPKWALEPLEPDDGACREVLDGTFTLDDKFSFEGVYNCIDLVKTAKRLSSACADIEALHKEGQPRMNIVDDLRNFAWQLINAVELPKIYNSERWAKKQLGLDGFIHLAETIVDLRSDYKSICTYPSSNDEAKIKEITERANDLYESNDLARSDINKKPFHYKFLSLAEQQRDDMERLL